MTDDDSPPVTLEDKMEYAHLAGEYRMTHPCKHHKYVVCETCDPFAWEVLKTTTSPKPKATPRKGKSDIRPLLQDVLDELSAWDERYGPDEDTQDLMVRVQDFLRSA